VPIRVALSVALVVLAALGAAGGPGRASSPMVGVELRERLAAENAARVIVALEAPGSRTALLRRIGPEDGFRATARWDAVAAVPGIVTAAGLDELAHDPAVVRVDLDLGGRGHDAESLPLVRADVAQAAGFTGTGVTVAVLDSGIEQTHPDLAPALVGEQCYVIPNGCPNGLAEQSGPGSAPDQHGHGTNVSGIVAGRGTVAPVGVAPGASVVAVKVLDRNNEFRTSAQIVSALNWLALNRPDVRVVNMSLGTFQLFSGACDTVNAATLALASAVQALRAQGVTVFASAGNEASADSLGAPACLSGVVAVGAVYDSDEGEVVAEDLCTDAVTSADKIACWSNSGAGLDLLAPGAFIVSTGRGGATSTFAGTSQASPHAAGAAALLLQQTPTLTADAVEAALESTGLPLRDSRNGLVRPRLDVAAALGLAPPQTPTPDVFLPRRSLSFSGVRVGASRVLPFTVVNRGNGVLTLRAAVGRPFSIVSGQRLNVPVGAQRVIRVRFAPRTAGVFRRTLVLTTNDADERRVTAQLTGRGLRR
jgi:subtilisin family serine protease